MKIYKVEQNSEEWRQFRLGKVTGSEAKDIYPLSRGTDRTPTGFWKLLGDRLSRSKDGEDPMARGHRLETESLGILADKYGLDVDPEPGVWVSDIDDDIMVSPDGSERSDKPTWAVETKSLSTRTHLKAVIKDRMARKSDEYSPIASLDIDSKVKHGAQAIQYFVVNEHLETLYFCFYDDTIEIPEYPEVAERLRHHVIEIKRDDILELIDQQMDIERDILTDVNEMIRAIVKEEL